jgi:hypothetical protein
MYLEINEDAMQSPKFDIRKFNLTWDFNRVVDNQTLSFNLKFKSPWEISSEINVRDFIIVHFMEPSLFFSPSIRAMLDVESETLMSIVPPQVVMTESSLQAQNTA